MAFRLLTALFLLLVLPGRPLAMLITGDVVWRGRVDLQEDVYVPEGATLTLAAGAEVVAHKAISTSIDPEFLSPETEIMVRGRLLIRGEPEAPVIFRAADGGGWAGIIAVGPGRVEAANARISGARSAVELFGAGLAAADCEFSGNRYGVVAHGGRSRARLRGCLVRGNDYGIAAFSGAVVSTDTPVEGNRREQVFAPVAAPAVVSPLELATVRPPGPAARYRNAVLAGDTVWRGRVIVDGILRVPDTARLIILPGAEVLFTFRDRNGDGIGESGIQVQGAIIAKGRPDNPIVFMAEHGGGRPGRWDGINILGSDRTRNLVEYCVIKDAYRGLHLHFANAGISHSVFTDNLRGAQFQESLVSFDNADFHGNASAVQARDSDLVIRASRIFANMSGVNLFRVNLRASGNIIANNSGSGLRVRDGNAVLENNLIAANRTGLSLSDLYAGIVSANLVHGNLETGILCRRSDGVSLTANLVTRNRGDGIRFTDARARVRGNLIAANGWQGVRAERFSGRLRANNIVANQGYAVGVEGGMDLDARDNWWGGDDVDAVVWDGDDVPGRGRVDTARARKEAVTVAWPLATVRVDALWAGKVTVPGEVTVVRGASLTVRPGTVAAFAPGAGLEVYGDLVARGTPDRRIRFTGAAGTGPSSWGEVSIERSQASVVEYCDFEYATWGLHCHFVPVTITGCRFIDSGGGIRFRSGPMRIIGNLFQRDRIGIRGFFPQVVIAENEFRDNEIALFIRQGGSGARIRGNNFIASSRYDIRLGDFNQEDVDAAGNYFDGAPQIFDDAREPGIGAARLDPLAARPFEVLPWLRD